MTQTASKSPFIGIPTREEWFDTQGAVLKEIHDATEHHISKSYLSAAFKGVGISLCLGLTYGAARYTGVTASLPWPLLLAFGALPPLTIIRGNRATALAIKQRGADEILRTNIIIYTAEIFERFKEKGTISFAEISHEGKIYPLNPFGFISDAPNKMPLTEADMRLTTRKTNLVSHAKDIQDKTIELTKKVLGPVHRIANKNNIDITNLLGKLEAEKTLVRSEFAKNRIIEFGI